MKKKISAILAMALCLSVFVGCSSKQNQFYIQLESGETVAYGMEKSEVEKLLGKPIEENKTFGPEYASGIELFYRNGHVIGAAINKDCLQVKTGFGVSIGDSVEQCKKTLGEPNSSSPTSLEYIYQLSDGKFSLFQGSSTDLSKNTNDDKQALKNYLDIWYNVNDNKINFITIMDMYFSKYAE